MLKSGIFSTPTEQFTTYVIDEPGFYRIDFVKGNAEYSILIDDYKENLKQWKGIPVKAINTINSPDANMTNIMGKSGDAIFEQFGAENFLYKDLLLHMVLYL